MMPEWAEVLVRVGAVLAAAAVLSWLGVAIARRVERRIDAASGPDPLRRRSRTLGAVIRTTLVVAIWIVALIMALDQVGVPIAPVLAAAGIGGIALGFGAQSLVRDVIGGFFVLFENHFDVGDVVTLAGVSGTVESITLRATTLRALDGLVHVVPNGEIRVSTNHTKLFSRYLFVLPVPYEQDVDRAVEVLRAVDRELRADPEFGDVVSEPLQVLGIYDFAESSVDVKCYLQTLPGEHWRVGRELRRRLKLALDEAGIAMAYPRREITIRPSSDVEPAAESTPS